MNETPTSGPMTASITHHERDDSSSRQSFSSSQRKGGLGKRKEQIFQVRGVRRGSRRRHSLPELLDRPFAADAAGAQQDEPIADPRRVADLVDREEQRAARRGVVAQRR